MKKAYKFCVLFLLLHLSIAVFAAPIIVSSQPDIFQSSSFAQRSSSFPVVPGQPVLPNPAPAPDHLTIAPELDSLKGLINTSLWTLHLSKTLTDEAAKDAAEQVYAASLDENERQAAVLGDKIVAEIKKQNGDLFDQFEDSFRNGTNNEKNGLGVLAGKIEELLLQANIKRQQGDYLARIKRIIAQSQAAQVSCAEWSNPLKELINLFGLQVNKAFRDAVHEYLVKGDLNELATKKKYIDLAFALYRKLNDFFCVGKRADETVQDVYNKASQAQNAGNYQEAITLYRRVIVMDPGLAAGWGCYYHIGECYRALKDYQSAVDSFKQSVVKDKPEPYQRNAYKTGLYIFFYDYPQNESAFLEAISYIDGILPILTLQAVIQEAWYDKGEIYERKLAAISGLTDEAKEQYYLKAVPAYRKCIEIHVGGWPDPEDVQETIAAVFQTIAKLTGLEQQKRLGYMLQSRDEYLYLARNYKGTDEAPYAYHSAISIHQTISWMYSEYVTDLEQKKKYALEGIDICDEARREFPAHQFAGNWLISKADFYYNLGDRLYSSDYWATGVLKLDRGYLQKAIEANEQYLRDYPAGTSYFFNVHMSLCRLFVSVGKSFALEKDVKNTETNYLAGISYLRKLLTLPEATGWTGAYFQQELALDYRDLGNWFLEVANDRINWEKYLRLSLPEFDKVQVYENADQQKAGSLGFKGFVFNDLSEFDNAITAFDQVISAYSNQQWYYWSAHLGKGDALYGKGLFAEAKSQYNGIFSLNIPQSYQESYFMQAYLGLGLCETELGNFQAAHENLAKVVKDYNGKYWGYDDYIGKARDSEAEKLLRVKIDPMIDTIAQGESKTFTATIVYPDDTLASVPASAATDWQWTCTGNEADGHVFSFEGNTATYKSGTGDFMDTIITAKCKVDAGMYGAKGRNKAVEPYIWIEGDNQVPICLVNEDGRRIKFAPMYVPWDGTDCGPPPAAETPVPMTLQFNTNYTIENPDQIKLSFWGPAHTHETEIVYEETDINSKIFSAADHLSTIEVRYPLPSTEGDIVAKRFKQTVPGTEKMKFDLYYSGEVISLEVPIWKGPGYGTSETRVDMYAASNQVFNKSDCEDLNPEDYVTKNTKMFVRVVDFGARQDSVTVKVKTSVQEKDMTCTKIKTGVFQSECVVPVNKEYGQETINLHGKERIIIKIAPGDEPESKSISIEYKDSGQNSTTKKILIKKPALIICALQNGRVKQNERDKRILQEISKFFGIYQLAMDYALDVVRETEKLINEVYCARCLYVPSKEQFDQYSPTKLDLSDYEMVYLTAQSYEENGIELLVFQDHQEWESGLSPNYIVTRNNLYFGSYKIKLLILNACNTGLHLQHWNEWAKTESLVGWVGTPVVYQAARYFRNFFSYISDKDVTDQKTLYKAMDYAGYQTPLVDSLGSEGGNVELP
ncbi:MAG: tetratricopeptide repeat protein [Candidatus Wallbacteria bacterium]|nr:tetratricopeptide repeat protein [Candidatus Wallbacteria bacterium]